jgi:membrane protein YdbS with pleckstrin-like domain
MKRVLVFGCACVVLAIALGVIQLWFSPWTPELFIKLELTLAAFFVIALVLWFTRREYKEYRKQSADHRLDD